MNGLNIAENIARLRHERKITQEQLADFVGVTKASVSKWETGQSLPDLTILPQLAAFFDRTIDELMGYEPQLGREQQRKLYQDLRAAFAKENFSDVMERSRALVKQYYSCYSFLYHVSCLWLNHYMMAEEEAEQERILKDASALCQRVIESSKDIGLSSDATMLNAMILLLSGNAREVIENLEEIIDPTRLSDQGEGILLQAYLEAGEREKANDYAQIIMYKQVLGLIGSATLYLAVHADDPAVCEETWRRIELVADAYDLEHLNANVMAQFCYQMALVYCTHQEPEKAAKLLGKFIDCADYLLIQDHLLLAGDEYFDRFSVWVEQLDLGGTVPRDWKNVFATTLQSLEHPAFAALDQNEEYQKKKQEFIKKGEKCYADK